MEDNRRQLSPIEILQADLCIGCGICAPLAVERRPMRFDRRGLLVLPAEPSGQGDTALA